MLEKHFGSQGPCSYKVITINPSIPRYCIQLTNGSPLGQLAAPLPCQHLLWIVRTPCQPCMAVTEQMPDEKQRLGSSGCGPESALIEACRQHCGDSLPVVRSSGLVGQLCHHRPHSFPVWASVSFILRSVCLRGRRL